MREGGLWLIALSLIACIDGGDGADGGGDASSGTGAAGAPALRAAAERDSAEDAARDGDGDGDLGDGGDGDAQDCPQTSGQYDSQPAAHRLTGTRRSPPRDAPRR